MTCVYNNKGLMFNNIMACVNNNKSSMFKLSNIMTYVYNNKILTFIFTIL